MLGSGIQVRWSLRPVFYKTPLEYLSMSAITAATRLPPATSWASTGISSTFRSTPMVASRSISSRRPRVSGPSRSRHGHHQGISGLYSVRRRFRPGLWNAVPVMMSWWIGRVGMARRRAQNGIPTHEIEHHRLRSDRIHQTRYPTQQPSPALGIKIRESSDFLRKVSKLVTVAINSTLFMAGAMNSQPVGRQRGPAVLDGVNCLSP